MAAVSIFKWETVFGLERCYSLQEKESSRSFLKDLFKQLGRERFWKVIVLTGYFFVIVVWRGRVCGTEGRKGGTGEGGELGHGHDTEQAQGSTKPSGCN